MDLKGCAAIVTGSSSVTGIGAESAKALAGRGCNVVINYVNNEDGVSQAYLDAGKFEIEVEGELEDFGQPAGDGLPYGFFLGARDKQAQRLANHFAGAVVEPGMDLLANKLLKVGREADVHGTRIKPVTNIVNV